MRLSEKWGLLYLHNTTQPYLKGKKKNYYLQHCGEIVIFAKLS